MEEKRQEEYESGFLSLLDRIETRPGMFIGTPSLRNLFLFIRGYHCALWETASYLLKFDRAFDAFVRQKLGASDVTHWFAALSEGVSDREAFDRFFELYHEFKKQEGCCPEQREE